jgi:MFS family permease
VSRSQTTMAQAGEEERDSDSDSDVNPLLGRAAAAAAGADGAGGAAGVDVDELLDRFGPFQWRLLAILGLGVFSVSAGLTMLPVFTNEDLHEINAEVFTEARMAVGSSLFFGCWGVMAPMFAFAADRRGRKPVLVVMLLATVVVGCLPVLIADPPSGSGGGDGSSLSGQATAAALPGAAPAGAGGGGGYPPTVVVQHVVARGLLGGCIAGLGPGPGYVLLMEWTPVHAASINTYACTLGTPGSLLQWEKIGGEGVRAWESLGCR